jgi:hypothetical protein
MSVCNVAIDEFNAQSLSRNWDLQCLPCDSFDNAMLADLHTVWLTAASGRGAPSRIQLSMRVLAPYLKHLAFVDRIDGAPHRYRIRFFGSVLATITGDHTGKYLDDVLPPDGLEGWTVLYELVIDAATPVRVMSNSLLGGLDHFRAEVYLAPIAAHGEQPHGLMGAIQFGPR